MKLVGPVPFGSQQMRRDIDEAMQGWPSNSEPGDVVAREIAARDGRKVLQIRVELGVLQMEVEGRPDGVRPHGYSTYLDYLRNRAGMKSAKAVDWKMTPEQAVEVDREFSQFYHRRVAWLTLQRYDRALGDADHSLALMNFVARHSASPEYIDSHERFRGLVLFHRTQAAAALALERRKPDEAVDSVREGVERLTDHQRDWSTDLERDDTPNETLIAQLRVLEDEIRKNFEVEKTLGEQLDEAVADEDYEKAARLRDQIRARSGR